MTKADEHERLLHVNAGKMLALGPTRTLSGDFAEYSAENFGARNVRRLLASMGVRMKSTRILAIAVLIASGLALYMAHAQQPGNRRIDLQRHDLSVPGRDGSQTLASG